MYMHFSYCLSYSVHLIMSCMHHTNCSTFMYSLVHVHAEPESEVQVEETNTELDQGKPWCIPPIILDFSLIAIFTLRLIVH
jgi:hypothetical protein